MHRAREKSVVDLIRKHGKGRFVDVGCGTGLILRHLPAGSIGIDINPRHLARAKEYAPSCKVLLGDAESIPLANASCDTVVCTEVLEHLVHPKKALSEIWRILTPRGVLIGSTPSVSFIWRLRFLSSTHYHNEPFHNEFTRKEITNLFNKWKIISLKPKHLRSSFFFMIQKP